MKMLIASDHAGFRLKEKLKDYLEKKHIQVKDLGTYSEERCNYPEFASALAQDISQGKHKQGILVCKSGIGNSIVANRYPGVRAALSYSVKAAKLSREHNDSNVLVLGSAFVNEKTAKKILGAWIETKFAGGRHRKRLNQLKQIEKDLRKWKA
ncbi:MAG: ribose 5-phosphate isomerase B [Candidatus Omnitrophica bacterium]|nr:ribose 5-phosphate isomerase B [Candidatus Omnitrophota bacterium]MDD5653098.1 ribose 5-phosphate isomerase B [Candidatus Omnitrophota bacterium]